MFDWLGDLVGSIFGSGDVVKSLFSKVAGAATNSLAGTPAPQSLMKPRDIRENMMGRPYGSASPSPGNTGAAGAAPYEAIMNKWERRMGRIMRKNTTKDVIDD